MIDTHAHILPGLDDGCVTIEAAVKIAQIAAGQGVTAIIATPHANDGVYNCAVNDIHEKCALVNSEIQKKGISIEILPGAEIRLTFDFINEWDRGKFVSLNNVNNYILLELPNMFILDGVIRVVEQISDRGIVPIIAHPERNPSLIRNPETIKTLVYEGAVMQLTASSITGDFGRGVKKAAEKICDLDAVHCIGSDIHPGRKYRMAQACKKLIKIGGCQWAEEIMIRNPAEIVSAESSKFG